MPDSNLAVHLIRQHDLSPAAAARKTQAELRDWLVRDHQSINTHEYEEEFGD